MFNSAVDLYFMRTDRAYPQTSTPPPVGDARKTFREVEPPFPDAVIHMVLTRIVKSNVPAGDINAIRIPQKVGTERVGVCARGREGVEAKKSGRKERRKRRKEERFVGVRG